MIPPGYHVVLDPYPETEPYPMHLIPVGARAPPCWDLPTHTAFQEIFAYDADLVCPTCLYHARQADVLDANGEVVG